MSEKFAVCIEFLKVRRVGREKHLANAAIVLLDDGIDRYVGSTYLLQSINTSQLLTTLRHKQHLFCVCRGRNEATDTKVQLHGAKKRCILSCHEAPRERDLRI